MKHILIHSLHPSSLFPSVWSSKRGTYFIHDSSCLLFFSFENLGKKIYTLNIKVILRMENQMVWVMIINTNKAMYVGEYKDGLPTWAREHTLI